VLQDATVRIVDLLLLLLQARSGFSQQADAPPLVKSGD